ncbi:hypothetical protein CMO91_05995 [Candidatus Woesearchaeota archaeon]|nr:hypothetical protein [Candidatus Woesearchaeota archaeon]|tara:strand:- start:857 stop:1102 length:246 start_codon:yes stop_codon:yes gene_type:complete
MVNVEYTDKFKKEFKKADRSVKTKAVLQIKRIVKDPKTGHPLRYNLTGERSVYVKPFRIIYAYKDGTIYFLRFEHRSKVYG